MYWNKCNRSSILFEVLFYINIFFLYLSVYVDSKLNWKRHIRLLRCKLSKIISFFHKLTNKLNESALLIILKSIFMYSLSYCIKIWYQVYLTNTTYINVLQNISQRNIYKIIRIKYEK